MGNEWDWYLLNPAHQWVTSIGGAMAAKQRTMQRAEPLAFFGTPASTERHEAILHLWDALSDFEAGQSDEATAHLMQTLCQSVGAVNASWGGAVRMDQDSGKDPLQGWRVAVMKELLPLSPDTESEHFAELMRRWNAREVDPAFLRPLQNTGTFRTYSLRREMPKAWFDSPFYKAFFESAGIYDSVFVGFPLNQEAESHFGFYFPRAVTEDDINLLTYALRGIKWFHRWLMLSHGLLMASTPLTPTERKVLQRLLTDASEKQIADDLGIAHGTAHQHVVAIFRKFGVRGRAGLMGLWLNRLG